VQNPTVLRIAPNNCLDAGRERERKLRERVIKSERSFKVMLFNDKYSASAEKSCLENEQQANPTQLVSLFFHCSSAFPFSMPLLMFRSTVLFD
jgi:hypothetical protein